MNNVVALNQKKFFSIEHHYQKFYMDMPRACLVLIASITLAGCFEVTEEVWINPDGTGRLKIDMGISEALLSESENGGKSGQRNPIEDISKDFNKAKQKIEKNPNIKKFDFQQYSDAGMKHFVFDVEVKEVSTLNGLQKAIYSGKKEPAEAVETGRMPLEQSELRIEKTAAGNTLFVRTLGPPEEGKKDSSEDGAIPDSLEKGFEKLGMSMARTMFGNSFYTVRLHGSKIISSNGKIDDEKKTAEWKVSIADLMGHSGQREFRAEIGSRTNWIFLTGIAFVGLVFVGAIVVIAVMRKKPLRPDSGIVIPG